MALERRILFFILLVLSLPVWAQEDYVLGSGDKIRIQVIGEPEMSAEGEISPQGTITFWILGDIKVAGKTVSELKKELSRVLEEKYIKEPVLKIEVLEYRSKEVLIHGAVQDPGTYHLQENWTTLLKLISMAGGVTKNVGSVAYIIRGYMNRPLNVNLVLKATKTEKRVSEAEQSSPSETAQEKESKKSLSQEEKKSPPSSPAQGELKRIEIDLKKLLVEGDLSEDKPVYGGDFVFISSIEFEELSRNFVWVEGAVAKPGKIPYVPGLTALQAVLQAGGLTEYSAPNRATIIRIAPDGRNIIIKVKLKKISKGKAPDVPLQPGDRLTVPQSIF